MRALVLDACLNDRAYDPQSEGPRVEYLLEAATLARLSSDLTHHVHQTLLHADEEVEDHWSLQQRVNLLVALSRQERKDAEEALATLYLGRLAQEGTLLDMLEVAQLEAYGPEGLLRVLRDRAHRSGNQPGDWDNGLLRSAEHTLDPEVLSETMRRARGDPAVKVYLGALKAREDQGKQEWRDHQQNSSAPIDYDQARRTVKDALAREAIGCPLALRSIRLTEEALIRLAGDVEQETDPDTLRHLLCAFVRRPFPGQPSRLLTLARHPDERVAERSIIALSRLQHPKTRTLATELLESDSPLRLVSAKLLQLNFQDGDEVLLRRVLSHADQADDDLRHGFCRDVREVADARPTAAMLALVADTYAHQPCSHCRHEALELLAEHAAVPLWLQAEARLDANPDTRQLFSVSTLAEKIIGK